MKIIIRHPINHLLLQLDEYVKSIDELWEFYQETELQFSDTIRVISLNNNLKVFSPKLYNILQSTCSQVENLFRVICERYNLTYKKKNFPSYFDLLNKKGLLETMAVQIPKKGEMMCSPFTIPDGNVAPIWWQQYNSTKHDLPRGFRCGNLQNVWIALSGLYAVHCISWYAITEERGEKLLDPENWSPISLAVVSRSGEILPEWNDVTNPKSGLFYCSNVYQKPS